MKVLISVDYGHSAELVLSEAQRFLQGFPAAEVYVFTVIEMAMIAADVDFTNTAMMDTMEREANEVYNIASRILGHESFIFSKEFGTPVDTIIEKAEEIGCDLIIMGTHGRKGLDHLIAGSVAEKVLRASICNTLIIPTHKKKAE